MATIWTLITVSYNSVDALRQFWTERPPESVEWLVVDNASSDESVTVAESLGARVIRNERNLGFGAANNVAFREARGRYVGFVNPDVKVHYGDLDVARRVLEENPSAVIAPQLVGTEGDLQQNGRGEPYILDKILHRLAPQKVEGRYTLYAEAGIRKTVPWLTGAVLLADRSTFESLGPWDERFFLYYEDTDLCLRARRQGCRVMLVGDMNWTHGWARSSANLNPRAIGHELASMSKFYMRYPGYILRPGLSMSSRSSNAAGASG